MHPLTNARRALPLAAALRLPCLFAIVDQHINKSGDIVLTVQRAGDDETYTVTVSG